MARQARYVGVYCVDVGGVNQKVMRKRFKPDAKDITFGNETFIVDISRPISRTKKGVYEYQFLRGKGQIMIASTESAVSPEYQYNLLKREYVSQLVAGMNIKQLGSELYIWALMGAVAGLGAGVAIGMMVV